MLIASLWFYSTGGDHRTAMGPLDLHLPLPLLESLFTALQTVRQLLHVLIRVERRLPHLFRGNALVRLGRVLRASDVGAGLGGTARLRSIGRAMWGCGEPLSLIAKLLLQLLKLGIGGIERRRWRLIVHCGDTAAVRGCRGRSALAVCDFRKSADLGHSS